MQLISNIKNQVQGGGNNCLERFNSFGVSSNVSEEEKKQASESKPAQAQSQEFVGYGSYELSLSSVHEKILASKHS